jgi:hypothetical protein
VVTLIQESNHAESISSFFATMLESAFTYSRSDALARATGPLTIDDYIDHTTIELYASPSDQAQVSVLLCQLESSIRRWFVKVFDTIYLGCVLSLL